MRRGQLGRVPPDTDWRLAIEMPQALEASVSSIATFLNDRIASGRGKDLRDSEYDGNVEDWKCPTGKKTASKGDRIMQITTEEVNRAHREDFYGALRKNDLEKLSQIYSDDYMLVRPDGSAFSKAAILDDFKAHSMSFTSIELANETIRIYGSVGVLTGDSKITTVRDGKESKTEFRLVAVYCKQSDRIELVHFQSSPLPG